MWQEDDSAPFDADEEQSSEQRTPAGEHFVSFNLNTFPRMGQFPHVVATADLYEAARARAVADQKLDQLFNPEYYI